MEDHIDDFINNGIVDKDNAAARQFMRSLIEKALIALQALQKDIT